MRKELTYSFCINSIFVEWVYILYSDCDTFFKIGITSNPRSRFPYYGKYFSYLPEHSYIFPCLYIGEASFIEKFIIREFSHFQFTHNLKFHGYTECFRMTCWYTVEDLLIDYFSHRKFYTIGDLEKLPMKMFV